MPELSPIEKNYDVTIIGGGIQGCAVAQACAAAGLKTLLVEKGDWGCATSSSSSKLIHGGLRYLQTGQFTLVKECLAERDWMIQHVPNLVQAREFYLPVYRSSVYRPWLVHLGLSLYRFLNWRSPYAKFKRLNKQQRAAIAGLMQDDLEAVFVYYDGQTDDRALTQAVKDSAQRLGAVCVNNTEFLSAEKHASGYFLRLQCGDESVACVSTTLMVNASGPWVNACLQRITPPLPLVNIELIQGTHIIVDAQLAAHCFYVEAPSDQRAIFIMPWQGKTLVGTTEKSYSGGADDIAPTPAEIEYLQHALAFYFPHQNFPLVDSFCGLRVLPAEKEHAFSRPREVMFSENDGLISLYGGKLTSWRVTAKLALARIEAQLGPVKKVDSRNIPL